MFCRYSVLEVINHFLKLFSAQHGCYVPAGPLELTNVSRGGGSDSILSFRSLALSSILRGSILRRCSAESICKAGSASWSVFFLCCRTLVRRKSSQRLRSLVVVWGSTALGAWRIPVAAGTCRYVSTFRCGFLLETLPVTSVGTLLFSLCVRVQLSCCSVNPSLI